MDTDDALLIFAALGQPTRLETFRLLIAREPQGVPAGDLARAIDVPQNTMSAHLAILTRAGLAHGERRSRSIVYRADLARVRALVGFLLKDCCAGRPELCADVLSDLVACEPTKGACV